MDIDDIEGIPIDEFIKRKRISKYSELIDYATGRIDDGMFYPFDKILRRYMPDWIEGLEEDSPINNGFYEMLRVKFRNYLALYDIYSSITACKNYGGKYAVVFHSKPLRKRDKPESLEQNEELGIPSAIGNLTKKQMKELGLK